MTILIFINSSLHIRGMRCEFLASYSRDLNPVELALSSMKDYLHGNGDYASMATSELSEEQIFLKLIKALYVIPPDDCRAWYSQCGYDNFQNEEQEPQSCSRVAPPQTPHMGQPGDPGVHGYPAYTFVFSGWGPPPVVYPATNHTGNPGWPGPCYNFVFSGCSPRPVVYQGTNDGLVHLRHVDIPKMHDWLAYLDHHEMRNKDGITFSSFGPAFKEEGVISISQLPFGSFNLTDRARRWNMKPGTAVLIMQYAERDLAAVKSGRLVIPKVHGA